jgi:nucleotide-binding universal stress UspA family protein
MNVKRILCPSDFSDCSRAALEFAIELAQRLGASVRLVHVFQLPQYAGFEDGLTMAAASADIFISLRKKAEEQLNAELERCRAAGVAATAEQVDGAPHAEIVKLSAEVDLVVMGTHGRTGLPRLVLGSTAERVVRLAKSPVLTVPSPEHRKA